MTDACSFWLSSKNLTKTYCTVTVHIRDLPHILKSSVKAILTGVFLISTTALFAQKKVAEYNHEDYITTIEQTCNRIKESHNIQWVYFRIANVDTTTYSDDSPPPPPFIASSGYSKRELKTTDFKDLKIQISTAAPFGEDHENVIESYGKGIVFSLPYSDQSNESIRIDFELADKDWCGTGKYNSVELIQ